MRTVKNLFESLTFNVIMSIVALAVLAKYLASMIAAASIAPGGLQFIIWLVIAYHFISASIAGLAERCQQRNP